MIVRRFILTAAMVAMLATAASAQTSPAAPANSGVSTLLPDVQNPAGVANTVKWVVMVTVLSLAPAVLVMVTSFTRIVVVLGLLRQALATQQLPPNQILFGLALLMTLVVMAPTYTAVHHEAVEPYFAGKITQQQAIDAGVGHVREFMIRQMEDAGNTDEVYLFLDDATAGKRDLAWGDVPTIALIPAFVVSELKVAFTMGFRIFLPFLVVDMLVSSVLVSMGMLMLPPVLVSLPLKLLLFVLADGWRLVVGTLMRSFG